MDDGRLLRCGLRAARTLTTDEPFEMDLAETLRGTVGADSVSVNVWRDWLTPGSLVDDIRRTQCLAGIRKSTRGTADSPITHIS